MFSEEELEQWKSILLARQQEARQAIEQMAEACEPVAPGPALGRLTRNDAMQEQQIALHMRRKLELQQVQFKTALERVAAGTFGICSLCKEPINRERLEMLPEAPLCVPCLDKRNKSR